MSSRPAYSLVYALIYMVVILLVATTALENVEGKRLHMLDVEHTAQARITARSSSESAYIAAKNSELGFETSGARFWWMQDAPGDWEVESGNYDDCIPENLIKVGDGCGKWKVMARAQENKADSTDPKLYTPIPNTGDAWDPDVCIKHFEVPRDADHPCNWNKIRYGEAVSIPLYYTNGDGDTVTPFEDSGAWYLRVRTPCEPDDDGRPVAEGVDGADCDRYELDDGNGGLDENVSVILWSLVGTNILEDTCDDPLDVGDGSSCEKEEETLFASVVKREDRLTGDLIRDVGLSTSLNTEITEKMVNDRKTQQVNFIDNVVLTSASNPALSIDAPFNTQGYEDIFNFMREMVLGEPKDFDLVSLRVEVVNPLMNKDASEAPSVPNLEWQLVSDLLPSQAVASDKALLTGFGYERGHKGVYSYPFRKTWDRIHEIIPNFTIAN